ncbi:hypothetical protein [Corallococcus praedator]|uniref:hypothetical protein n=1 Tax=Corallococcus praedator TaxID=2316724 RepID=UPI0011C3B497|nr:hypothetical protein [Corallococcus praedator]
MRHRLRGSELEGEVRLGLPQDFAETWLPRVLSTFARASGGAHRGAHRAQRPAWRIAFASPSLAGLWAAAEAGLGVTLRTAFGLPKTLAVLEPGASGLPALGSIPVHLLRAEREPSKTVAQLAGILREALAQELTTPRRARPRGGG